MLIPYKMENQQNKHKVILCEVNNNLQNIYKYFLSFYNQFRNKITKIFFMNKFNPE